MVRGYNNDPGYDEEGHPIQNHNRSLGDFAISARPTGLEDAARFVGRTLQPVVDTAHAGAHRIADTVYEDWVAGAQVNNKQ